MDPEVPDILDLVTRLGTEERIPILNRRPPATERRAPSKVIEPKALKLFTADQLTPYRVLIWCGGCGRGVQPPSWQFAAQAKAESFKHLLSVFICDRCGGLPRSIEISQFDGNHWLIAEQIIEASWCRRYSFTRPLDEIRDLLGFTNRPNQPPRPEIVPGDTVSIVARVGDERRLGEMEWGFIPTWATDPRIGASMINARAEDAAGSKAFGKAFRKRRCLVPADGFFEWKQQADGGKQLWRFALPDGGAFAFAGIWEKWRGAAGEIRTTFAILTMEPYREVRPFHDRSPVILAPEGYEAWLSGKRMDGSSNLGVSIYKGDLTAAQVDAPQ